MTLWEKAKASVGEKVVLLVDDDGDRCRMEGVLAGVSTDGEEDPRVLSVKTEEKTTAVPLSAVMQFFLEKELKDDKTEYFYVIFRYGKTERSKEHIYMSYDDSIKPGDKVLVWQDWLYVGNVIRTGFFKKSNAPYPVEKTWLIQKKVYPRVDYTAYPDAGKYIAAGNLYKDKALNSQNDHRQFLAVADMRYRSLAEENTDFLEGRKGNVSDPQKMAAHIVGQTEYELDWDWCESNQIEVFYRTLWICSYMAKYSCYHPFYFDKYACLSLVYRQGGFDPFLLAPLYDKAEIEKDMALVDSYIASRR